MTPTTAHPPGAGQSLLAWKSRLAAKLLRRQRLKDRLNLILCVVIFTVCVTSLIALQIALRIYDNTLYRESAKVLNLSSLVLENELKKVEDISFLILADASVQSLLSGKRSTTQLYERYRVDARLQQSLNAYAYLEEYIASINLIDSRNNRISLGWGRGAPGDAELSKLISVANRNGGKNVWVVPAEDGQDLLAVRAIRQIENLTLDYLGLLIIRLDMRKLIGSLSGTYPRVDANLQIVSGEGKKIHSSGVELDWKKDVLDLKRGTDYGIKTIGSRKYFTAFFKSDYTNWTYINILPYEIIYQRIFWLRNLLVAAFIALFALVIWMGVRFTSNITKPIENLASIIKKVEKGDFSLPTDHSVAESSVEEIKNLYTDFSIMIGRINTLIQEDYKKQILIKDTKYRALQAQINPHFLYNTLDSINWMAKANQQAQISTMVEALANLLRRSISKQDVITIQEELEIVGNYIAIQKIRYEERLDFSLDVEDGCLDCLIPKLTIQPIVENAVNYGLEKMVGVCRIKLGVIAAGGIVTLTVEDNGPGVDTDLLDKRRRGEGGTKGSGIGLKNIDDRLKMFFGSGYCLRVTGKPEQGTQVTMAIPARTA